MAQGGGITPQELESLGQLLRTLWDTSQRQWIRRALRVAKNARFFLHLFEYAETNDPSKRAQAQSELHRHLYLRSFAGDAAGWELGTKGFAKDLLSVDWIGKQLQSTPHLGALGPLALPATRLQYALLTNDLLLKLKEAQPGYGLSSKKGVYCRLPSGRTLSTLEVTQSWSILLNLGHLFGTFATERALFYELLQRKDRRASFLRCLKEPLRAPVEELLNSPIPRRLYYALAAWRLSRAPLDNLFRMDAVALLKSYLECERSDVAAWAFRSARQLSYNKMHLYVGAGSAPDSVAQSDVVNALVPYAEVGYESSTVKEAVPLTRMLDAFDAYELEHFFAGAAAANLVLRHIRDFRRWWRHADVERYLPEAIDRLFAPAPADWPEGKGADLSPFVRLRVPGAETSWLKEIHSWIDDQHPWESANVLVTPTGTGHLICDVYVSRPNDPSPRTLRRVAERLAAHSAESWRRAPDAASRELWRSAAVLGVRCFMLLRAPTHEWKAFLKPAKLTSSDSERVGYAIVGESAAAVLRKGEEIVTLIESDIRRREFSAALRALGRADPSLASEPALLFIGALVVSGPENGLEAGDFDGAWVFFCADGLRWFFLEHKVKGQPSAAGSLEERMRVLNIDVLRVERWSDGDGKVGVAEVSWTRSASSQENAGHPPSPVERV